MTARRLGLSAFAAIVISATPVSSWAALKLANPSIKPSVGIRTSTDVDFDIDVVNDKKGPTVAPAVRVEIPSAGVVVALAKGASSHYHGRARIPKEGTHTVFFRMTGSATGTVSVSNVVVSDKGSGPTPATLAAPSGPSMLDVLEKQAIADGVPKQWARAAAQLELDYQIFKKSNPTGVAFVLAAKKNPAATGQAFLWAFARSELKPFFVPFKAYGAVLLAVPDPRIQAIGSGLLEIANGGELWVKVVKVANGQTAPEAVAIDLLADMMLDKASIFEPSKRGGLKNTAKELIKQGLSDKKSQAIEAFFAKHAPTSGGGKGGGGGKSW